MSGPDPVWRPTWTQAMTDFRGADEPFDDVTVRMTVPASIGGTSIRIELSNRFGDDAVLIGRGRSSPPACFPATPGSRS